MATVPSPPVLGPLTLAPSNVAPPGQSRVEVWFWEILGGKWVSNQALANWDDYPAGYYATAWAAEDGVLVPNSWGEHSVAIVITSRTKPDGTAAPYVLEQPPNAAPVPECPPGMLISFPPLYNVFGYHLPLCELTAAQSTNANCPPGTEWDPIAEICKAIVIPPIFVPPPPNGEPPPPPPPPPTPSEPDPYGDEITYDLCLQMAANTQAIIYAINQLQVQQGQGLELDACCVAVVNAVTGITNTLGLIFNLLSKYTGAPAATIDLSPIVNELTCLCESLTAIASAPATDLAPVTAALDSIRDALAGGDPNIKRIADDFDTLDDDSDPEGDQFVDYLVQQGALDSGIASKIKGSQ